MMLEVLSSTKWSKFKCIPCIFYYHSYLVFCFTSPLEVVFILGNLINQVDFESNTCLGTCINYFISYLYINHVLFGTKDKPFIELFTCVFLFPLENTNLCQNLFELVLSRCQRRQHCKTTYYHYRPKSHILSYIHVMVSKKPCIRRGPNWVPRMFMGGEGFKAHDNHGVLMSSRDQVRHCKCRFVKVNTMSPPMVMVSLVDGRLCVGKGRPTPSKLTTHPQLHNTTSSCLPLSISLTRQTCMVLFPVHDELGAPS